MKDKSSIHPCTLCALVFCLLFFPAAIVSAEGGQSLSMQGDIKSLRVEKGSDTFTLKLSVGTEKRCMFGDLDLINLELQHAPQPLVLQLSLEAFGAEHPPIVARKAPGKSSDVIGEYLFDIPKKLSDSLFGLYICSYPEGEKAQSCSNMAQKPFDEMFLPYQMNMDKAAEESKEKGSLVSAPFHVDPERKIAGHVYFFRFFFLHDEKVYFPVKAMNAERYNEFFKQARSSRVLTRNHEDSIVQRSRTIGSLPLTVRNGHLSITLPFYAAAKCR